MDTLIAISHPGCSDILDPAAQQLLAILARFVPVNRSGYPDNTACPPKTDSIAPRQVIDQVPALGGLQSFFESTS